MALAGQAVMINWCNVDAADRVRFYAWHTRHHMADRVGIAGFQRSRRHAAIQASSDYFFIYEVESLAVLTGQDYRTRLDNPSEFTRTHHGLIKGSVRLAASVLHTVGVGQGACVLTARCNVDVTVAHALDGHVVREIIPAILDRADVVAAHWLLTDANASGVTRPGVRAPATLPSRVLIVEALSPEALDAVRASSGLDRAVQPRGASEAPLIDTYRLEVTVARTHAWVP